MSIYSDTSAGAGNWLVGAVKNNPEGLLLLAAGCALLMRVKGSSRGQATYSNGGNERPYRPNETYRARGQSVASGLSEAAQTAGEYVSEMGEKVMDTASDYASSVSSYADDAARAAAEQTGRLAQQAQETLQATISRVVQERPLAVALAGVAAGAAVAAAFPSTDLENRTLGATGERLRDAAVEAGGQLKKAATKAGQRLAEAADERGLNTEGLKEVARDVGDAFSTAMDTQKTLQTGQLKSPTSSPKVNQGSQQSASGQKGGSQ